MKITRTLSLLLIVMLLGVPGFAQAPAATAISQDPPDSANPPSMEEWSVPSHGVKMNAVLYLAGGDGRHGLVILLHGFPGYERNFDLAQSMRRAGWDVLVFHYRGAWGSPGDFSFANAMQDTEAAVEYARSPEVASKFHIDPRRIVLIGHSMGGFMAAYAGSRDPRILGVAMLAAWNIGADGSLPPEARKKRIAGMEEERGPLHGCTAEGLMNEIVRHATEWDYTKYAPSLKSRSVLIISTNDMLRSANEGMDAALRRAGSSQTKYVHLETDHGFSSKRIALQQVLLEWLATL
jgi:pimeloyl-ACP methyl ester carboxylesterase